MSLHRPAIAAGVLSLLTLCVAGGVVPGSDPHDIPPQDLQTYSAQNVAEVLARRLEPLLEGVLARAVEQVLASGRRAEGDELAGLRARLEDLERELAELKRAAPPPPPPTLEPESEPEPAPGQDPEPTPAPKPEPEPQPTCGGTVPEPNCEAEPEPLAAALAPFERPERLACACSCLQLRNRMGTPQDGVYWFTGMTVPSLCDFSHDGGGWTLLLTARSRDGWNLLSVLGRRKSSPSLEDNYSILEHADAIRDLGTTPRFAYRIETQAEKSRQRWGGVWFAPNNYSFVHEKPDQTEVFSVKRFDKWTYKANGIKRRMPWLNMHARGSGNEPAVLTTGDTSTNVWGTMLNDELNTGYQHSPWIHPEAQQSGTVLYWMRENTR